MQLLYLKSKDLWITEIWLYKEWLDWCRKAQFMVMLQPIHILSFEQKLKAEKSFLQSLLCKTIAWRKLILEKASNKQLNLLQNCAPNAKPLLQTSQGWEMAGNAGSFFACPLAPKAVSSRTRCKPLFSADNIHNTHASSGCKYTCPGMSMSCK